VKRTPRLSVPAGDHGEKQQLELSWWRRRGRDRLIEGAKRRFTYGRQQTSNDIPLYPPFFHPNEDKPSFNLQPGEVRGKEILDVGCGPKPETLALTTCARVSAIDPLLDEYVKLQPFGWEMLVSAACCTVESLPYLDNCFDMLFCFDVLTRVRDAELACREMRRVLRPGGELLLACYLSSQPTGTNTVALDREMILSLLGPGIRIQFEKMYEVHFDSDSRRSRENRAGFWLARLTSSPQIAPVSRRFTTG
jgi:2-polyprenyl-3-methyl-5-hydroxy-6-metoxy-1,4-benzoquinol methylase